MANLGHGWPPARLALNPYEKALREFLLAFRAFMGTSPVDVGRHEVEVIGSTAKV